jgi:hypothetical protein
MSSDAGTSNNVYVLSKEHSWVPARVLEYKEDGKEIVVSIPQFKEEDLIQSDGGKTSKGATTETVLLAGYPNKSLPLQNVDEQGVLLEVEDMVDLPFLHEVSLDLIRIYLIVLFAPLPSSHESMSTCQHVNTHAFPLTVATPVNTYSPPSFTT